MSSKTVITKVEGHEIKLSNLDKVLYPDGFTKRDVIHYYTSIAPLMLPHLKGRLLTMKRYPQGADHDFFYEKRCPPYRPAWVKTAALKTGKHPDLHYCVIDNLPSLVWVANLASLEFHILLSKVPKVTQPTCVVFDIDPGPGMTLKHCAQMALKIKGLLQELKLEALIKSSGGKGLHLYVPLNTPGVSFPQTKNFARSVALTLEKADPDHATSVMKKEVRKGRLFIDWSQNDQHKTTVAPYSLRARPHPAVSAPLTWEEVKDLSKGKKESNFVFTAPQVLKRVKKTGDLFESLLTKKQKLPSFGGKD